jgi:Tfp pilus assembly protein PilN
MRPVNLLPYDQRRGPAGARPGSAYVVVGVLGALLVMAVAYVLSSNQANARKSDAAAARIQADRLEREAQQRASFTDFAQIKETRLASVATVAASRFDWERLMRELARIMPGGSWLQSADASVAGTPSSTTAGAAAASTSASAAPTGPSAQLIGCTPRQSDVARMMVRLREVHRVEDVKLNQSSQETADAEASVEACGSLYKFDLTVTFTQSRPVVETPRGARGVPASLGGGS